MRMDSKKRRKSTTSRKVIVLAIAAVLLLSATVTGTLMYLVSKTTAVTNTFEPATVTCEVQENFEGKVKKDVTVKNTYRVNADGERIGGTAAIPGFTPGEGWFEKDGFYYYKNPVAQNKTPAANLIGNDGITLVKYTDADGGRQVIEVIAEAIQSVPTSVVKEYWNVTVDANGVISAPSGSGN